MVWLWIPFLASVLGAGVKEASKQKEFHFQKEDLTKTRWGGKGLKPSPYLHAFPSRGGEAG
jgi:hypothetical protein